MAKPSDIELDKEDISSYSDENIAKYLRNLQHQSLEDLIKLQTKIAEEYANATQAYQAERSSIRWARRRYWTLIFVGIFRELYRVLVEKKEWKINKLKSRKAELKEQYNEQEEAYETQLTLVHDSIATIQLYSGEVSKRTLELDDLKQVIEGLDATCHQINTAEPEDRLEIERQLTQHIEDREILEGYITELCKKTELLVNALAGTVNNYAPDYLPKDFLSDLREANLKKIAALKERCKDVNHPIIPKLLVFLSRQTAASLTELQAEIAKEKNLFQDRALGDLVWDANTLYPAIFEGKNREQALFDYVALQERELASLQEVIETTDAQLQKQDNPETREILDHFVDGRNKLISDMSHLLLLHRDMLSGNHSELLEKVHLLARQHNEGAKANKLQRLCEKTRNPMTQALHYFLIYRTDASLQALKLAMEKDPTYLESRELVHMIEEAGTIDERITEGWVKEEVLPSTKEIQQRYIQSLSNKAEDLDSEYETLTDQRVLIAENIKKLEDLFQSQDRDYTAITNITIRGYLTRAELNRIKADPELFQSYEQRRAACISTDKQIKGLKEDLTALNLKIQRVVDEQEGCKVTPIEFTPEILHSMIEKCKYVTRMGRCHPVATALGSFLNYPTPSLLTKLKLAMQEHGDYQSIPKLVQLLTQANQYFPYIQREKPLPTQHLFDFFKDKPRVFENETDESLQHQSKFGNGPGQG